MKRYQLVLEIEFLLMSAENKKYKSSIPDTHRKMLKKYVNEMVGNISHHTGRDGKLRKSWDFLCTHPICHKNIRPFVSTYVYLFLTDVFYSPGNR